VSNIPYPPDFDIDTEADRVEVRRQLIGRQLDPGDVIATLEDTLAQVADPAQHPLYPLVAWLLDRQLTPGDGAVFWDHWKRLACQAIDQLVDEALAREEH
jgi:hypothetical protein